MNDDILIIRQTQNNIEKAIIFLVKAFENKKPDQEKPVILHSLRVAFQLLNKDYDEAIIIAAVLHDILEDTNTKPFEINEVFGSKIAKIVKACSYDVTIEDETNRWKELFVRTQKCGKEALIIKTADILDNAGYFHFIKDVNHKKRILEKWQYFLNIAKDLISQEPIYVELKNKLNKLH